MKSLPVCVALLLVISSSAFAAMGGSYEDRNVSSPARLELAVDQDGHVTGKLSTADKKNYTLNGEQLGSSAQGALNDAGGVLRAFFFAEQETNGVSLQFIPSGKDAKPDLKSATLYAFVPLGTPRAAEPVSELRPGLTEEGSAPRQTQKAQHRLPLAAPKR